MLAVTESARDGDRGQIVVPGRDSSASTANLDWAGSRSYFPLL